MFDSKILGDRIRELRGKTPQEVCARELGISRGAMSYYENGTRNPDADVISRMCRYFNVSADYLLGLSDMKTADQDIKIACKTTGFSEEMIKKLQTFSNRFESELYSDIDSYLYDMEEYKKTVDFCKGLAFEFLMLNNHTEDIFLLLRELLAVTLCEIWKGSENIEDLAYTNIKIRLKTLDIYDASREFVNDVIQTFDELIQSSLPDRYAFDNKEDTAHGEYNPEEE